MTSEAPAASAMPMAEWFAQWTEQQRKWVEGLRAAAPSPVAAFTDLADTMATWAKAATLPRDPLGTASWQSLPSMADALLGRIESGPTLAPLWDFDRKAAAVSAAWWRLQLANQQYRQLVEGVWPNVQQAVLKRRAAPADKKPGTARAATELWLEELNRCLLELMRTPQYLKAQRETLDAGLALHEKLGEIAGELCEWLHLPSRSEIDDLTRTVTELRREVRAAQRATAATSKQPSSPERRVAENAGGSPRKAKSRPRSFSASSATPR